MALLKLVKLIEPDPLPFSLTSLVRISGSFFSYTLYTQRYIFATRAEKKSQAFDTLPGLKARDSIPGSTCNAGLRQTDSQSTGVFRLRVSLGDDSLLVVPPTAREPPIVDVPGNGCGALQLQCLHFRRLHAQLVYLATWD